MKNKIKIFHISDTHQIHEDISLNKFKNIDILVHSGDAGNSNTPIYSETEIKKFIEWYAKIDVKYKIFVAGNHDTAIEKGLIKKKNFTDHGIIYLENEEIIIEGLKFWGSPITPEYGNWSFMRKRDKIHKTWEHIPNDIDVLITHGPALGILDLTLDRDGYYQQCGCRNLLKHIYRVKPKLFLFGHIHNCPNVINSGIRTIPNMDTIFSNGSMVTDGKFDILSGTGNYFEL